MGVPRATHRRHKSGPGRSPGPPITNFQNRITISRYGAGTVHQKATLLWFSLLLRFGYPACFLKLQAAVYDLELSPLACSNGRIIPRSLFLRFFNFPPLPEIWVAKLFFAVPTEKFFVLGLFQIFSTPIGWKLAKAKYFVSNFPILLPSLRYKSSKLKFFFQNFFSHFGPRTVSLGTGTLFLGYESSH